MLVNQGPSQHNSKEEMRCYSKTLYISYKDHVTNEEVLAKIQQAIGPHEDPTIIKDANCSGMDMSSIHLIWPKASCKAHERGKKTRQKEDEVGMDSPGVKREK